MSIKQSLKSRIAELFNRCATIRNYEFEQREQSRFGSLKTKFNIALPFSIIGEEYMSIGANCSSFPGLRMECLDEYNGEHYHPQLIIGDNTTFNYYCHVGCINRIEIGNNVLIGSRVLITDHSHGKLERTNVPFAKRKLISKGPVIIEDNVWIGENACIMPGVRIGTGSIIGANAVVTHDVPAYSLAVGAPAKVVKQL